MYTVIINEGPLTAEDNAFFFCQEPPLIKADVIFPSVASRESALDKEIVLKWVVYTPNNGPQKGKKCQVPYERLVAIIEDPRREDDLGR